MFASAALPLAAATRTEFLDVLMKLAAALAANDAYEFFRHIDKSLPGRGQLEGYIAALTAEADITSSVEVTKVDGDTADADWYMQVKNKAAAGPVERRRRVLKVRMSGEKVSSLDPIDFFAPMRVTG